MARLRREIRIIVLQSLYENEARGSLTTQKIKDSFNRIALSDRPAVVDNAFAINLLTGVSSRLGDIDSIIRKVSEKYPLEGMCAIERNVLRMGIFEILFGKELNTPKRVAINEAVDVAKLFSGDPAGKFVNGILGAIYRELDDDDEPPVPVLKKNQVGALIYRVGIDGEVKFAFINDTFGKWTLSKGTPAEDIDGLKEALKEVIQKELGIEIEIEKEIFTNSFNSYPPEGKTIKTIKYFLASTTNKVLMLKETEGIKAAEWFTHEEALKLPFYSDIKDVIIENMDEIVKKH